MLLAVQEDNAALSASKLVGWYELDVHGLDGQIFRVVCQVKEPGIRAADARQAMYLAPSNPSERFSDSYIGGRLGDLRTLDNAPSDLWNEPMSRHEAPQVLAWKIIY